MTNPRLLIIRRLTIAFTLIIVAFLTNASSQKTECNVRVTLLQVNDVY